ncbi:4961_t:CDS:10 [Acaulospora morrowiae]|uniref:4961_t:CDS:1 n=1 Tax=Acaulospora morrowiae TaxID=94023 RepID=A0A9N8ZVN7_9GLOM|nr:4961_t:CDS:10 [Acaulospora morrowiae]
MNSVPQVDELVKEYLLFRGFSATFRSFEQECKNDKNKGFQAERIIDELYSYVANSDINGLLEYWKYLDLRYFSRLDVRFLGSVKKFETSLLRYYLVYAIQQKRRDKVLLFFDSFGTELSKNAEWSKWFGLPFSKNPATDPNYETFFTKQWLDKFTVSFHNFLNSIFQNMPHPSLLCFNIDRYHRHALQSEIDSLQGVIENLKSNIESADQEIASLRQKVQSREAGTNVRSRRRAKSLYDSKEKDVQDILRPISNGNRSSNLSPMKSTPNNKAETNSESNNGLKSPEVFSDDRSMTPISEYNSDDTQELPGEDINPFTILSQEIYLEHASGISLAKFSHDGNLIASCDVDNIVRIWNYTGASAACKIKNDPSSNILCLEWEARSDKLLLMGTDERQVRVYNRELKSVVHEFQTEERFPRVKQISYSPVESLFACSGSPKGSSDDSAIGSLMLWNLKTMSLKNSFVLDHTISKSGLPVVPIETIKFNHNGQMLVTGDRAGCIRIFDIRSLLPIMEWNLSKLGAGSSKKGSYIICSSQFSFDENSIYVVDEAGSLTQWSVHKPGHIITESQLAGFTSTFSSTLINFTPTPTKTFRKRTPSMSSVKSTKSNRSTSSVPAIMIGNETTHLMSTSRVPMVSFSGDTEHVVCVGGDGGHRGVIYQTSTGNQVQLLASHSQPLTAVDWTTTVGNTILTAASDGTVRVTKMVTTTSS